MDIDKLKRKNNTLTVLLLVIILFILVVIICCVRVYLSGSYKCVCEECKTDKYVNTESLDNTNYIGIYDYSEDGKDTTLILNSDYSAIFYVERDDNKAYYYGKYKIEDKRIVLYNIILNDSSVEDEMYINDEEIYFNIVSDVEITTLYGYEESIHFKKIYNLL